MKAAILSFAITLGLMMAFRFSLNHRAAGVSAPTPGQESPGAAGQTGKPSALIPGVGLEQAQAPGSAPVKPTEHPASDAGAAPAIADLTARIRGFTSKRGTGGNIVPWWAAVCELAELDPPLAIALLREAPHGFASAHSLSGDAESIIAWWAARDPDAALAWYWRDLERNPS